MFYCANVMMISNITLLDRYIRPIYAITSPDKRVRLAPLPTTSTTTPPRYIEVDWATFYSKLVPYLHERGALNEQEFQSIRAVGVNSTNRARTNQAFRQVFNADAFNWTFGGNGGDFRGGECLHIPFVIVP